MEVNVKKIALVLLVLFIIGILFIGIISFFLLNTFLGSEKPVTDSIAVIDITGPIIQGGGSGAFGTARASSEEIMKYINQAQEDQSIEAILLKVNSPGGSSAASDAIYQELKEFKETGRPIVVSMGETAASGGYYISVPADEIYANPATITGSIGVIMKFQNLAGLYDKLGVENTIIKSGKHKDIGSSARSMTDKEKKILQKMVDDVYERFVKVVAEGRNIPEDKVKELADGRIYSGERAKEINLVDKLGNFYDAVEAAAKLAEIKGEPNLIYYGRPSPVERLLGAVKNLTFNLIGSKNLLFRRPAGEAEELLYYQLLKENKVVNLKLQY